LQHLHGGPRGGAAEAGEGGGRGLANLRIGVGQQREQGARGLLTADRHQRERRRCPQLWAGVLQAAAQHALGGRTDGGQCVDELPLHLAVFTDEVADKHRQGLGPGHVQ